MEATTSGRFRVLARPRDRAELLLIEVDGTDGSGEGDNERTHGSVDVDGSDGADTERDAIGGEATFDPVYVESEGYGTDLVDDVATLYPGNLIEATLGWADGSARFLALAVVRRTRFAFVDGVTGVFEAARDTWEEAATAGEAMNSRVTHGTDGQPNGVLYTFAKQESARDLFEEFRNGLLPLEPLLARANAALEAGPRDVFVMRPADEPFVLVYIVFERDGLLARTIRETYDVPPELAE